MVNSRSEVPAAILRPVVEALRRAHVDVQQLLRDVQIDPAIYADPNARIPRTLLRRFWECAPSAAGDEALGFRAAECVELSSFGIRGYIAKTSATAGDDFRRGQRYAAMRGHHLSSGTMLEGDRLLVYKLRTRPVPRMVSDFEVAALVRLFREFYAPTFPLLEVRFSYSEPSDAGRGTAHFNVPVRFGYDYDAIVVPASLLDMPRKDADEQLCRILEQQFEADLNRHLSERGFAARARQVIVEQLQAGDVSAASSAKQLAVSPRTMRRKLHEEGTSHAQLLDRLRHRLALQYMVQGHTNDDVARLLGFEHGSAFRRALRRWNKERLRSAPA